MMDTREASRSVTADLSPREAASALGVSESSVKRWCDQGQLQAVKTPGGHRRLSLQSLLHFARETGRPLRSPLPIATGVPAARPSLTSLRAALLGALLADDAGGVFAVLDAEAWAGRSIDGLCDELIAPTLAQLGERWHRGRVAIYQERRACELVRRALFKLGEALSPRAAGRGLALGGTLEGDPYELPTLMAELVLRERGYDARSLGIGLPAETIARAIADRRPRLVWIAAGGSVDEARFAETFASVAEVASRVGAAVAVGGRALTRSLRQHLRYSTFCDAMGHLAAFADALAAAGAREPVPGVRESGA